MGNETSTESTVSARDSLNGNAISTPAQHQRRYAPKSKKRILIEQQNRRTDSMDSDCGSISLTGTAALKAVSRKTSQQRLNQLQLQIKPDSYPNLSAAANGLSASTQHLLTVPSDDSQICYNNNPPQGNRKGSCSDVNTMVMSSLEVTGANNRRRSRSLCSQQMKADCQSVQQQNVQNNNTGTGSRRSSNGTLPSLTRLRIQQCYKHSKSTIGQQILRRACTLRSEMKGFLAYLDEDRVEELANELHNFITDCVNSIENADNITDISRQFGTMHVQLCNYGFRPEYFSIIADATIAECVRLDGGTHKRCETLLAWSQLMAFMFSGVRDGYYAEIRQQRRSSLPQHKMLLKQSSTNVSIDVDA